MGVIALYVSLLDCFVASKTLFDRDTENKGSLLVFSEKPPTIAEIWKYQCVLKLMTRSMLFLTITLARSNVYKL